MNIIINHAYKDGRDPLRAPTIINSDNMLRLEEEKLKINEYSHSFCPAFKQWHRNKWKVVLNRDLILKINKKEKTIETNISIDSSGKIVDSPWKSPSSPPKDAENCPYKSVRDIFLPSPGPNDSWPQGAVAFLMDFSSEQKLEVQCYFSNLFWTESKDVWITLLHHPKLAKHNIELIPGTFPISVWPKEILFTFKIIDSSMEEIFLPKDTVLFYVSFYSRYKDPLFKVKAKEPNEKLRQEIIKNQMLKTKPENRGFVWKIIIDRLKKDKTSKCPFDFIFRK